MNHPLRTHGVHCTVIGKQKRILRLRHLPLRQLLLKRKRPQLVRQALTDRQKALLTQLPIKDPANKPALKPGPLPLAPKVPPPKPVVKPPAAWQTAQQERFSATVTGTGSVFAGETQIEVMSRFKKMI